MKLVYVVNADWYFCLHWLARAKNAVESGYEVYVLAPKTSEECSRKIENAGCKKIDLILDRSSLNIFSELSLLKEMYRGIKKINPDVVHSITVKPNIYSLIISRLLNIPIASSVTGLGIVFSDPRKRTLKKLLVSLYRFSLKGKRSKKLLFESQEDLDYFKNLKLISAENCVKVNGAGVDTDQFSPKFVAEEGERKIRFLFAARLLKSKGLTQLAEAFDQLPHNLSGKIELLVCGIEDFSSPDGLTKEDITKIKQLKNVVYLGQRDDIDELMDSVDVVCLPTLYGEGIPRILIEGASSGKALIASNRGGCKEICINDYNGVLLNDVCVNDIQAAIAKIASDGAKLKSFGENGRSLVLEKFDEKFVISQNNDVYSQLLSEL